MKLIKRLFLVILIVMAILLGALFSLPFLFKDEIVGMVKEEINRTVAAKVDFEDIDLTLFKRFPNLSLEVENYSVTGIDDFGGITLAKGPSLGLTLDLMSVVRRDGPVKIKTVNLEKPEINIVLLKSGKANYNIAIETDERIKETAAETDYSNFVVSLSSYTLDDATIIYDDRSTDTYAELREVSHNGTGKFTIDIYDLITTTQVGILNVTQGGIKYLSNAKADLDAIINIDQPNSKYTFKENELLLNALKLNVDGYVQLIEEDIYMDLEVTTPQNDFKSFLSLIPSAYTKGYEQVKADGRFVMKGLVRGTYNGIKEVYPAFQVNLDIENANVKYPDLPLGISNIAAKVGINSPSSNFDEMVINIPQLRMKVGNNPFEAVFRLETPISDPNIDTKIDGVINLGELAQAFPMEGIDQLNGIITADVEAKTRMSYIDKAQYDKVNMKGNLQVKDMIYQAGAQPAVNIRSMDMAFNPKNVQIRQFDAKMGKSDIKASGTIDNILAYFSPEKTMTGNITASSNYFNADEWMAGEESTTAGSGSATEAEYEVFDRFDFKLDATVKELDYDAYKLKNTLAKGQLSSSRMKIDEFETQLGDSRMKATGEITNVFPYLFEGGTLGGRINFQTNLLDLNQFMASETGSTTGSSNQAATLEPIQVPGNLDLVIASKIERLLYDNIEFQSVNGNLVVENKAVILDDMKARALGGDIMLSGAYDTKDPENPGFEIKYDLQKLDFRQAFEKLNTFQTLAPIAEFIEGNFTTSLIMNGKLGKDLMPKLNTLNAQGFLQTLNAVIANFKPLQAIGNALQVEEFKEALKIKGTKNWFEVKDGKVEVKEFDYDLKDIAMKISGSHSLDQAMDYKIKAKIPRKFLESNAVGATATRGLDVLTEQANKLGLDLKKSEFVNVMINLTGSIKDPKVKFNLVSGDGESSLVDSAKDKVKDELQEQKDKLLEEGKDKAKKLEQEVKDSVKTVVDQELDKAKDKAKETLEKEGEKLGSTVKEEAKDVLGEKGKEEADKIKNALEDFNPFKKKKDKEKKKDGGN